jgi:hypothetical protein
MTYKELVEKLTDYEAHFDQVLDEEKAYDALRAVVELHKPREEVTGMASTGQILSTQTICAICTGLGAFSTMYPCPTVQAIEKELG